MPEVLVVAGEESGDILAAAILKPLKKNYSFFGFGGRRMKEQGVEVLRSTEELATIGFLEAIQNYRRLRKYLFELVDQAVDRGVTHAILIDYPGFNLQLARRLKKKSIKCIQVVSPTVWAWHYGRVKGLRRDYEAVLCLYRFEVEILKKEGINAHFIGHPMVGLVNDFKKKKNKVKVDRKAITLLPGSRQSEIKKNMPFLLSLADAFHERFTDSYFILPVANEAVAEMVQQFDLPEYIKLSVKGSHDALARSYAAVACSGTVTLECTLFDVPFLIIYSTSIFTYVLGRRLVRVPYIGMANIMVDRLVAREYIQKDMHLNLVLPELIRLVEDGQYRSEIKAGLEQVRRGLGEGSAAKEAARILRELLSQ